MRRFSPDDSSRRSLDAAAELLAEFRRQSGSPAADAPPAARRAPPDAGLRSALEAAEGRVRALQEELGRSRGEAAAAAEEIRFLREAAERDAADAGDLRARAAAAVQRADALAERAVALEGDAARLESLRRAAERALTEAQAAAEESVRREAERVSADAESASRALEESLRRELVEAVGRSDAEIGAARRRAEEAESRAADAAEKAVAAESQRAEAQSLAAEAQGRAAEAQARRADAEARRAAAETQAAELRQRAIQLEAERARLESLQRQAAADAAESEALRAEETRALMERAAGLEKRLNASSVPPSQDETKRLHAETDSLRKELAAARAELAAYGPDASESRADEPAEMPPYNPPPAEPVLDPGWARFLRLVRPPVESAYAHLRRLSGTALTTGQKALVRMAAASVAQASDSLSCVELALEEGPFPAAPASVLPVLEQCVASWEAAFRQRGVALAREWPASLPETPHDPKALRILVYHVLRNVLEAVPHGGRLTVRAFRGADGAPHVEFVDDGPGFTAAWLARRFEPFAAPRKGRAGLGLSLVRRTLRRWGGDAEASNVTGGHGARLTWSFAPPPPPPTE